MEEVAKSIFDEKLSLTVEETAKVLSVPAETVYKLARTKRIPSFKVGRLVRFNVEEIKKLMQGDAGKWVSKK